MMTRQKKLNLIEFESKKGGIAIIKVNQDILNSGKSWEQLSLMDKQNGIDFPTNEEQIPNHREIDKHQKGNNSTYPPLAKESIKETSKEIIKDYWFKDLKKVWFNSAKTEALKKQIFQRFNPDSEPVFNQLPLNTRKKIIQSLEFAFVDWNK